MQVISKGSHVCCGKIDRVSGEVFELQKEKDREYLSNNQTTCTKTTGTHLKRNYV